MDFEEITEGTARWQVLEFLTEHGYLEGAAQGIALQVMDMGEESLKGAQQGVFEKCVVEKYFKGECKLCHIEMPTSEILAALVEEDELCSSCRRLLSHND